jgi:ubiquinol-cytochrome c reductase cytochrome b subunit
MSITERVQRSFDESSAGRRLTALVAAARQHPVHLHWTNLLGVVTAACIAVLFLTGVVLMFFYTPSSERVVYDGGYLPLHGTEMSKALESTLAISFDVRGGLLLRQAHHWAALLLPAALILQLAVTFFTGAFRRPRQWSWVVLFLLLIAALAAGWSGYALPDDLLSGTGLVIVQGIVLGIPVVGTWIAALLFGGGFPGRIIENLYPIHLLVSAALLVLVAARLRSAWVHGAQHFPGRRDAVVPLLPTAAKRGAGLFAIVFGALMLLGATVTVGPVWLYGPSDPGSASAGSQPDWYTGFLDGALRLVPPGWEVQLGDYTLTLAVLVPLAVVGAFLAVVLLYPFLENWITRGAGDPGILDRPRNVPVRTAIGVAGIAFYGVLWGAASADVAAALLHLSLEGVLTAFQVLLFAGPVIAFVVTHRICLGLQRKDRDLVTHGYETGRIVRLPGGEYIEVHRPIGAEQRGRLAAPRYAPVMLRPNPRGRITLTARIRSTISRVLFRDELAPVTGSIGTASIGTGSSTGSIGTGTKPEDERRIA